MKIFLKWVKISFWILINGSYKCCITVELIQVKELILLKVITVVMGLDFKILFVMLTMPCVSISDVAVIAVKGVYYHCHVHDLSRSKEIHLL